MLFRSPQMAPVQAEPEEEEHPGFDTLSPVFGFHGTLHRTAGDLVNKRTRRQDERKRPVPSHFKEDYKMMLLSDLK